MVCLCMIAVRFPLRPAPFELHATLVLACCDRVILLRVYYMRNGGARPRLAGRFHE